MSAATQSWHWLDPSWNDRMVEYHVVAAVNTNRVKVREWVWPMLKPYNGCSGEQRIVGWQKVWAAINLGILPRATMCSICGSTHRVQYHNEDYLRPLAAKPVCSACHRVIHTRFYQPRPWMDLLRKQQYDGAWFMDIVVNRERTSAEAETQNEFLKTWPVDRPAPMRHGLSWLVAPYGS